MADIHDRAVIATVAIAIDQKVTATLRPHMAQSHGFELPNFGSNHANQFVPPSPFGQYGGRVSCGPDWLEGACQVMRCSRAIIRLSERMRWLNCNRSAGDPHCRKLIRYRSLLI